MTTIHEMIKKALDRVGVVSRGTATILEQCPGWFTADGQREIHSIQRLHALPDDTRLAVAAAILVGVPLGKYRDLIRDPKDFDIWKSVLNRFSQITPPPAQAPVQAAPTIDGHRNINEAPPGANDQRQEALFAPEVINPPRPAIPDPAPAKPPLPPIALPPLPPPPAPVVRKVLSEDELNTPQADPVKPTPAPDEERLQAILAAYVPGNAVAVATDLAKKYGMKRYEVYSLWVKHGKRQRMIVDNEEIAAFFKEHPEYRGKISEAAAIMGYSSTPVGDVHRSLYNRARKPRIGAPTDGTVDVVEDNVVAPEPEVPQ